MRWFVLIIVSILAFMSCDMKNDKANSKEVVRSMNQPTVSESELKEAILYNGNTSAYDELSVSYLDHNFQEEFLFYAMIMANRYDYPQAYFDVYFYLTQTFSRDIKSIDERSAKLAIEYLLKSYEKGHHQAREIVEEFSVTSDGNSKQQIERIFKE